MFDDFYNDGAAIYKESAARIAKAVDLNRWSQPLERWVVERVVHSAADPALAEMLFFAPQAAEKIAAALQRGGALLCDSQMTLHGLVSCTNKKICLVDDSATHRLAAEKKITRSLAQIYRWQALLSSDVLAQSVVVIGNAPTCLYGLLQSWRGVGQESLSSSPDSLSPPSLAVAGVIAMPVGMVGAAESKQTLVTSWQADNQSVPPFITLMGPRGGSSLAAATANALLTRGGL